MSYLYNVYECKGIPDFESYLLSGYASAGYHWQTSSGSGQGSQRKRKSNPEAVRRKRTIVR